MRPVWAFSVVRATAGATTQGAPYKVGIFILAPHHGAKKEHTGMAREEIFLGSRIIEKNGLNPSEISRGRRPCGREPPVKRRTPFPENITVCSCVSLGPDGFATTGEGLYFDGRPKS